MIKLFQSGTTDIHRSMAAIVYRKDEADISEDERYNTKQMNFAVLYGAGAKTTAQEMKGTEKQGYQLISRWHKTFPRWEEYVREVETFVINNHYVRNLFGRYRNILIIDPESREGMTSLRKAVNAPIQGGLSDLNKLCGYNIWRKLQGTSTLFIMETHDSWKLDMLKEDVPFVARIGKEEYENVNTQEFGFKFKVPMKVDFKVGPNARELEPYD